MVRLTFFVVMGVHMGFQPAGSGGQGRVSKKWYSRHNLRKEQDAGKEVFFVERQIKLKAEKAPKTHLGNFLPQTEHSCIFDFFFFLGGPCVASSPPPGPCAAPDSGDFPPVGPSSLLSPPLFPMPPLPFPPPSPNADILDICFRRSDPSVFKISPSASSYFTDPPLPPMESASECG